MDETLRKLMRFVLGAVTILGGLWWAIVNDVDPFWDNFRAGYGVCVCLSLFVLALTLATEKEN